MLNIVVALFLFGSSTCVYSLPSHGSWYRYAQEVIKNKEHEPYPVGIDEDPSMHWFTQRLDHFDRQVTQKWQQRSFQNDTFFDGTGPVFICVGGEGPPLDASVLIASVHCNDMVELAPQVGALMVALEHRYYGASMPTGRELSTQKLRWLSSQQALGDLAEFHSQIVSNYSLTDSNKWVSFGGSYPGMMSGFFRLKYPNLVHASVSSSSPWNALLDMQQYQNIVGDSLAITSVGGSDQCKSYVVDGHNAIASMITTSEGRSTLASLFNFCDAENALSTELIAGEWAGSGVIEVPSQENDPSCSTPGCDINSICQILENSNSTNDDIDENVLKLVSVSNAQNNNQCILGWTENDMKETYEKAFFDIESSARSWPYQTCTEFGFYQTCEYGSRCPFVQGYQNLSQQVKLCERMFDISQDFVQEQIDATNACYGADQPKGSRILFPNGNVDPWSGCGVLTAPTDDEPVMMVDGSSHHFWTHPANEIIQESVQEAKLAIQEQVVTWLNQED
mmetsp:Transcript_53378/g.68502  ORF Transcript_53378/g.68502 Transcript_53378/m.68502 type:complete len:507 (-) Transcript_53378:231-1751(-)